MIKEELLGPMKILILNGPNLNLLGTREPEVYGDTDLDELIINLEEQGKHLGLEVHHFQSNSEGELIDKIHHAKGDSHGIIFNPGAYSHYSYAIRDAIVAVEIPVIEIHISNISARESFRNKSVIAPVCIGQINGLGTDGYGLAMYYFAKHGTS